MTFDLKRYGINQRHIMIFRSLMRSSSFLRAFLWGMSLLIVSSGLQAADPHVSSANSGLELLYLFDDSAGSFIKDQSAKATPINLLLGESSAIQREPGRLQIRKPTILKSQQPATRAIQAIRKSGEVSLELWLTPSVLDVSGPARIFTISKNSSERNLTLGQNLDKFEIRLRTSSTSTNGIPALESKPKVVQKRQTYLVYTRSRSGQARLYVDGRLNQEIKVPGDLKNWDSNLSVALGNELTKDRPWAGVFHRVALHSRALSAQEVLKQFQGGTTAPVSRLPELATRSQHAEFFETKVAPVFVKHCFECHDASTKKGGLDLSRKVAALKGGEGGEVFVAGNHSRSLLWKSIQSDEMPQERTPLTAAEKEIVKSWIDQGAHWTLAEIDAEVFLNEGKVAGNWIRRLTRSEYIETVRATLGVDITQEADKLLPPDLRADGFSNTAYNLNIDLKHVNAYAQLAELIVARIDIGKFARRFTQKQRPIDDEMRDLVAKMGQWILRGPLSEQEINTYRGISSTVASAGGNYEEAIAYTLQAMLQSPRFLYRMERQLGDETTVLPNSFELASRISYIVWGAPPDEELYRAAEKGELFDLEQVERHVRRMLEDRRAREQSVRFVDDWLNLNRLDNLRPNSLKFPNWKGSLASEMREETREFFREIIWNQKRPLADLLNAQTTYLTPALAVHYRIDLKVNEPQLVDLQNVASRGGLLTQGSVLTVGGDEASMVSRGLFVLHDLLRGVVKDPPPCVDSTPIPTKPGRTQRAIAMDRLANGSCRGCHSKFEPLAFALEKFDGLGAFHETDEHGNQLREDGEILFPGQAKSIPFKTSADLMDLLAESDRVSECLTWKVIQFSLGRPLVPDDVSFVKQIHQQAQDHDGTWSSLITALILSDLVQTTRTETAE